MKICAIRICSVFGRKEAIFLRMVTELCLKIPNPVCLSLGLTVVKGRDSERLLTPVSASETTISHLFSEMSPHFETLLCPTSLCFGFQKFAGNSPHR